MFGSNHFYIILFLLNFCLTFDVNEQCLIGDTCTNSSLRSPSIYNDELYIQSRNCFCDSACEEYGDCCYSTEFSSNKYQCVDYLFPIFNDRINSFDRLSIWMRSECLSIYIGSKVDKQCRNLDNQLFVDNPILFIPVTSLQTNITYRNYYCAYCNNDANENIKFWEYKPFCYGTGTDKDYLVLNNDQQVQYYIHNLTKNCLKTILYPHDQGYSQPSVFIRPCKNSIPSTCPPETSDELARNCSSSPTAYRYVQDSNIIYPNPYCAECNHINNTDELTCLDPNLRTSLHILTQMRVQPLSILFDPNLLRRYLNNDTIPSFIYSINYNCTKPDELYDLFEKQCSPVTNSSQEFIISMECSYPMQTFIQSNEKILYNNGSLYVIKYSILLTKDEYVFISDNRIVFCADQWANSSTSSSYILPSFPFYRDVLSTVCASISLTCLILFGIIFWLIPSLQNLPGKCLLLLSISLFIGQLTFVFFSNLTEYPSICFASAILIHYFYLSSFLWLLILSIHIHSTFNNHIIQKDKSDKKHRRLIAYNILVWCLSGIIILIASLIQITHPESSFSPAYGFIFCSISKVNAMITFFLAPIGCILLIVGILFLKTLIAIYRSRKIAKLASSSNTKDNKLVFIYARLASIMGIQWILLIGALAIQQTWLWVLFEIINSLPGLFICFGFLCSIKVLNQLKQIISMKLIIRRQSSRSNTTTSSMLMSPPINITKKFRF
jgi:G protein-coupled receptor Mth (Methuselah protein)